MNHTMSDILPKIEKGIYLPNKQDNKILSEYLKAKTTGVYHGLMFGIDGNGCAEKTLLKNATLIRQCLLHINKPFHKITRDDAINFRNNLATNEIKATKFKLIHKKSSKYQTEMKYRTKQTLLSVLKQFWSFYMEYARIESKQELTDIFHKLKLPSPKETEHKLDYLESEEMRKLLKIIKEDEFKFMYCLAIDTAGRPIELANLRKSHFSISENGNLMVKLPEIKGISGRKHKFEVLYEKEFIEKKLSEYTGDQLLFDFIDEKKPFANSRKCFDWDNKKHNTLNIKWKYWTNKATGRSMTMYALRKTATMYWLKVSDNDILWTQQRLGHVEGSRAIKHYITLQGIETPEIISKGLNKDKYKDVADEFQNMKEDYTQLKLQNSQMAKLLDEMKQQLLETTKQLLETTKSRERIIVVDNKDLAKKIWEGI